MSLSKIFLVAVLFLVAGCVGPNPANIKPIQSVYSTELKQVKIGMNEGEFQTTLPEAVILEQDKNRTTFNLTLTQVLRDHRRAVDANLGMYNPRNITNEQSLLFYFESGHLVRWNQKP